MVFKNEDDGLGIAVGFFMFFSAAALAAPMIVFVFSASGVAQTFFAISSLTGALCLWTGWAIWWSRRQREFGIKPKA